MTAARFLSEDSSHGSVLVDPHLDSVSVEARRAAGAVDTALPSAYVALLRLADHVQGQQ
jgi:hypothetical protein